MARASAQLVACPRNQLNRHDKVACFGRPFSFSGRQPSCRPSTTPDARSGAGDLNLTIYSLRKGVRLALRGNPTILLLLFTPDEHLVTCDALGAELRALAPSIVSRRAQGPYLGYLQAQKQRLTGERGQKRVHRPELEALYGFDTKYAMHMLRLGFQGVELLTTGRLSLPTQEPARSFLLDVRRGRVSEQACLERPGELELQLTALATASPLPPEPDEARVEDWVLAAYRRSWRVGG